MGRKMRAPRAAEPAFNCYKRRSEKQSSRAHTHASAHTRAHTSLNHVRAKEDGNRSVEVYQ